MYIVVYTEHCIRPCTYLSPFTTSFSKLSHSVSPSERQLQLAVPGSCTQLGLCVQPLPVPAAQLYHLKSRHIFTIHLPALLSVPTPVLRKQMNIAVRTASADPERPAHKRCKQY